MQRIVLHLVHALICELGCAASGHPVTRKGKFLINSLPANPGIRRAILTPRAYRPLRDERSSRRFPGWRFR